MANNFNRLQSRLFDEYANGNTQSALDAANEIERLFPDRRVQVRLWQACLLCSLRKADQAEQRLVEGVNEGMWWNPQRLEQEEDLVLLRTSAAFQQVVITCKERFQTAQQVAESNHLLSKPKQKQETLPLLSAMHMRGGNMEEFSSYWKCETAQQRYLSVFPLYHGVHELKQLFDEYRVDCELMVHEGLGHFFPDDFSQQLDRILSGFVD